MAGKQENPFKYIDRPTLILMLALVLIGWVAIHAAVYSPQMGGPFNWEHAAGRQAVWILTSVFLFVVLFSMDYRLFEGMASISYIIMIGILVATIFLGKEVNGAKAWIQIGPVGLQPGEFAKLATCLMVASYLSSYDVRLENQTTQLISAFIILVPAFLIILSRDTGSALVYASFIFVLQREGLSIIYLVLGLATIAAIVLSILIPAPYLYGSVGVFMLLYVLFSRRKKQASITAITWTAASTAIIYGVQYAFEHILQEHQKTRILLLLGKIEDPSGAGYNVNQSLIAIGSGGFLGKGWLNGTQTKFDYVPEQTTDFIFCTIGEEWGFVGSTVLIILFGLLLFRIIHIGERMPTKFGRIYAYGVASIIFFHVLINLGMTMGILPVIGIPLPFISYGGSSLWAISILMAILLRMDAGMRSTMR